MNKPFSIMIEETKQNLVDIINKSNLHPSILELIVKDVYLEVNRLKDNIAEVEKQQYLKNFAKEIMTNQGLEESVVCEQALPNEENLNE